MLFWGALRFLLGSSIDDWSIQVWDDLPWTSKVMVLWCAKDGPVVLKAHRFCVSSSPGLRVPLYDYLALRRKTRSEHFVTHTCTVLNKFLCFWIYILCIMKRLKGQRSRPLMLLRVCCYVPSQKESSVDISCTPGLVGLYAKLQLYIANCLRFLFPLFCQHFVLKLFLLGWFVMRFTFPFWDLKINCMSDHLGQGPMHLDELL